MKFAIDHCTRMRQDLWNRAACPAYMLDRDKPAITQSRYRIADLSRFEPSPISHLGAN